ISKQMIDGILMDVASFGESCFRKFRRVNERPPSGRSSLPSRDEHRKQVRSRSRLPGGTWCAASVRAVHIKSGGPAVPTGRPGHPPGPAPQPAYTAARRIERPLERLARQTVSPLAFRKFSEAHFADPHALQPRDLQPDLIAHPANLALAPLQKDETQLVRIDPFHASGEQGLLVQRE